MFFVLVDKILDVTPGESITAMKALAMAEEYLKDHFPRFPVMPGVLMLESMFETGAWLVRASHDFNHSMVRLAEARNVKYADFVRPGQQMVVTAQIHKEDDRFTWLKTQGTVSDRVAVSGRLVIERYNLADEKPERAPTDTYAINKMRKRFDLLYQPSVAGD